MKTIGKWQCLGCQTIWIAEVETCGHCVTRTGKPRRVGRAPFVEPESSPPMFQRRGRVRRLLVRSVPVFNAGAERTRG